MLLTTSADILSASVFVYPRNTEIAANGIFLVEFTKEDFVNKGKTPFKSFYAVSDRGKVKLNVVQINFSGTRGQVLLSPSKPLHKGDSIRLQMNLAASMDSTIRARCLEHVEQRRWHVAFDADTSSPSWATDSITFVHDDGRDASHYFEALRFSCQVEDNFNAMLRFEWNGTMVIPMLYEIRFNGEMAIEFSNDFTPMIYFNEAGRRNFNFSHGKEYNIIIRPMDGSGNYGPFKTLVFQVPN